jgi:trafficking protein particle complex subunit 11
MDAYPTDYIAHNLPLILISGLEEDNEDDAGTLKAEYPLLLEKGPRIFSDISSVGGDVVDRLRQAFLEEDASHAPWNSRSHVKQPSGIGFRLKSIGRVGQQPFI